MKKLLLFFLTAAVMVLSGGVTGEYAFELTIDETMQDLSGNGNHPVTQMPVSSWINDGMEALRFARDGEVVSLPAKVFPGARGSLETVLRHEQPRSGKTQYIFSCYSARSDGFYLTGTPRGDVHAAYYDRSAKKWYRTPGRKLPAGKFVKITVTWELPGSVKLYIDGKSAGEVSIAGKPDFSGKYTVTVGGSHIGQSGFRGAMHRLKLTDAPDAPVPGGVKLPQEKLITAACGGYQLQFAGRDLGVRSMKFNGVEYISAARREPLWSCRLYNASTGKYMDINAAAAEKTSFAQRGNDLELRWHSVAIAPGESVDVSAVVTLNGDNELQWRLRTGKLPGAWRVDQVAFPRLSCAPTSADPQQMYLTYPRYYGVNQPDPFTFAAPKDNARYGNAYPGGAHWQFGYLYGKNVPGLYFHAADSAGCYKELLWTAHPEEKSLIFELWQPPEQRAISREFVSAYPVVTAVIPGDWYDAARRYRAWAVKQQWCAAGTLEQRKGTDIPEWAYDLHIAARVSTLPKFPVKMSAAAARIPKNMVNIRKMFRELDTGALSVWYNYNCAENIETALGKLKWMAAYNGRSANICIPGVKDAVAEMKAHNFYNIGYINSRIFDESTVPGDAETQAVVPAVMRDLQGDFQRYGKVAFDVCRASEQWQDHLLKLIRRDALAAGFAGMYLDSFGRGQYHCFADNHGHKPGCSRASVQGQRVMAQRIKQEMRKVIPGFTISSEASIEQFVDLIDFKLHHHNVIPHGVPVWAVLYHDYQFVYGRTVSRPRVQVTKCFHIGALLGRIFTDSPKTFEANYFADGVYGYYRKLIAMRRRFYGQIGMGEMIRTPEVVCSTPAEQVNLKGMRFEFPAINASAWRDSGGTAVIFFTNHTKTPQSFSWSVDARELPGKAAQVVTVSDRGEFTVVPHRENRLTLEPLGVAAVVYPAQ